MNKNNRFVFTVDCTNTNTITIECKDFIRATELLHEIIKHEYPCDKYEVKDFKRIRED